MKISVNSIKQSKLANWLKDFCNKNWVAKTIAIMIIWFVVAIPCYIYFLVRWGIGPSTFWEEIALLLVSIIAIGWLQGILLFFGIIISLVVAFEDL